MKKVLVLIFALCILLTGCGNNGDNGNANVKYDYVEYENIDELNKVIGSNLVTSDVEGTSNETFGIISSNIAQYTFTVNNEEWCVRASADCDNDISGIYSDSVKFEKDITATYYTDDYYVFRFFNNDIQYVITLNVLDKDIEGRYFDDVVNEFKTNITGVKSGYDVEVIEDGDNVINKTTLYNDDGTAIVLETIYAFENDKMVSILNKLGFETEEAAKEYYDQLVEAGSSADELNLEGTTISYENNSSLDFYSEYSKAEFIDMLNNSFM